MEMKVNHLQSAPEALYYHSHYRTRCTVVIKQRVRASTEWKRRIEEPRAFSGGQFYRLHSTGAFHTLKGHQALGLTRYCMAGLKNANRMKELREKGEREEW